MSDLQAPTERVMMTFVNMDSPGLVVLPTHRVVFGLEDFTISDTVAELRKYFEVEEIGPLSECPRGYATPLPSRQGSYGSIGGDGAWRLFAASSNGRATAESEGTFRASSVASTWCSCTK